ncbi:MAG TPA: DUF4388 domain-containing protein [Planctomycetota bacterium]|nr:DUF4388 domain-containing protein [Planctomycetota bacterium]
MERQHLRDRTATVLIIDQNPEVGFGLRASLGKQPHLRVVEASDQARAMDVLVTQVVDVIVVCVGTPNTDALQLLRQLRQQEHLAALPFLLVAEDDRVAAKVDAFQQGATDYIARPFAMAEVVARVEAAVRRQLANTSHSRRAGCLGGDFQTIAFTDLVHLLQIAQRTGILTLLTPHTTGQALFVGGQVYHATFGTLEGEEAFYRQVFETQGQFEFRPCEIDLATVRNTVALTTTTLLMEAARRLDSWRRDHPGQNPDPMQPKAPAAAAPGTVLQAVPGTASAAAELQQLIAGDPCASLLLLCRDQLPAFTSAAIEAGRCLVLLVADATTSIATACAAAAPLGPEFVDQALAYEQKVLVLRWRTASGACLDVMLLDQEFPGHVLNELRLQPNALVLAPRGGDWFALSLLAQNELGTMLEHLRPGLLLGLGDAEMSEGLRFLQQRCGMDIAVNCLPTPIKQWANLRDALREVLQHWAAGPAVALAAAAPTSAPDDAC